MARNKQQQGVQSRVPTTATAKEADEKLDAVMKENNETVHQPLNQETEVEEAQAESVEPVEEKATLDDLVTNEGVTDAEEKQEDVAAPLLPESEVVHIEDHVIVREEEEKQRQENIIREQLANDELMSKLDTTARMSINGIRDYVVEMTKVVSVPLILNNENLVVNIGPQMQAKLFKDIMDIITETSDEEFRTAFNYVMSLFTEHKDGALSALNLSRYQENIPLDAVSLKAYPRLMTMLTTLCDPLTRKRDSRNVDMNYVLEFGFSDSAKSRLTSFFQD